MDTRSIEVEIYGEKINLLTNEDEIYIKELAGYVNDKMVELFKYPKWQSEKSSLKCILLGMNLADELFKEQLNNNQERFRNIRIEEAERERLKKEFNDQMAVVLEKNKSLMETLDSLNNHVKDYEKELDEKNKLIHKLQEELEGKLQEGKENNQEIQALREKLTAQEDDVQGLRAELDARETELAVTKGEKKRLSDELTVKTEQADALKKELDEFIETFDIKQD